MQKDFFFISGGGGTPLKNIFTFPTYLIGENMFSTQIFKKEFRQLREQILG